MRLLESILVLSQVLALILIGYALFAPFHWTGSKSDLENTIHRGGDYAVERWLLSEQIEGQSVRRWGVGMGAANFVLATAAIMVARRRKADQGPER